MAKPQASSRSGRRHTRKQQRQGPRRRAIALVVAHPDDVAFCMGGTALLLKDRYRLHVLCASKGERGLSRDPRASTARIREKEEAAACARLGAELTFLGETDGEIFAGRAVCTRVAGILKRLDPAALFTLWPVDVPDHVAASGIGTKALRMAGRFDTTQVYFFEAGMGGQTNQFEPDLYVNIDAVAEGKRELIRCHACQNPGDRSAAAMLERDRFRGRLARCEYAEGFRTPNPLIGTRWNRRAECLLLEL